MGDESLEGFDAEGELAPGEGAFVPEGAAAEPAEGGFGGILGAVDDPQVLPASAPDPRLGEPFPGSVVESRPRASRCRDRDKLSFGVAQGGEVPAEHAAGVDADGPVEPDRFGDRGVAVDSERADCRGCSAMHAGAEAGGGHDEAASSTTKWLTSPVDGSERSHTSGLALADLGKKEVVALVLP